MAMLAEPRRKQKVINLRAKSNAWSNDANKFGQRMLEKMGWSSGKGLGAKENGIVEHVVAKYKNDDRGLGFEDKNDQWTKHEDDFNALLANLSNGDNNDEKLHSGISLEDKSKKSKARVHYHKFTRGKDLTKYSEKDLANIFGKKSFKNEEKPEEVLQDDIRTTEQVFTEKGSMEDYFKNKLAAFKSKNKLSYNNLSEQKDCDAGYRFQGFSGTNNDEPESLNGFGYQSFSSYGNDENESKNENSVTEDIVSIKTTKKSKKKKKHQDEELLIQEENCDIHSEDCKINKDIDRSTIHEQNIKTKKKKRKNKEVAEENFEIKNNYEQDKDEAVVQIKEPIVANKKSKKKNKELEEIEHVIKDDLVPKKKKKRKCVDREN